MAAKLRKWDVATAGLFQEVRLTSCTIAVLACYTVPSIGVSNEHSPRLRGLAVLIRGMSVP
eukprot:8578007-Pyramimonas_sp.AAC.1